MTPDEIRKLADNYDRYSSAAKRHEVDFALQEFDTIAAARQRIEQLTATNAELNILSSRQAERIESLESQVAKLRLELSDTQEHYATIERLAQRVVDTEWGWDGSCGADIPAQEIIDLIGDLRRAAQVLDEGGKS